MAQAARRRVPRVVEQKSIDEIDDQTLILADVARKALEQVKKSVTEILTDNQMSGKKAKAIAEKLSTGIWTHDYPIRVQEAQALGLSVSTDMPKEIYQLMNLYLQATQRRPSVEYIPTPYAPPAPEPAKRGSRKD